MLTQLGRVYDRWLVRNDLPQTGETLEKSVWRLLGSSNTSEEQLKWLKSFMVVWEEEVSQEVGEG